MVADLHRRNPKAPRPQGLLLQTKNRRARRPMELAQNLYINISKKPKLSTANSPLPSLCTSVKDSCCRSNPIDVATGDKNEGSSAAARRGTATKARGDSTALFFACRDIVLRCRKRPPHSEQKQGLLSSCAIWIKYYSVIITIYSEAY